MALAGRAKRGRDPPEGPLWVVAGGGACLDASPGATTILAVEGWTSYSRRSRHDRAEGRPYAGGVGGCNPPTAVQCYMTWGRATCSYLSPWRATCRTTCSLCAPPFLRNSATVSAQADLSLAPPFLRNSATVSAQAAPRGSDGLRTISRSVGDGGGGLLPCLGKRNAPRRWPPSGASAPGGHSSQCSNEPTRRRGLPES